MSFTMQLDHRYSSNKCMCCVVLGCVVLCVGYVHQVMPCSCIHGDISLLFNVSLMANHQTLKTNLRGRGKRGYTLWAVFANCIDIDNRYGSFGYYVKLYQHWKCYRAIYIVAKSSISTFMHILRYLIFCVVTCGWFNVARHVVVNSLRRKGPMHNYYDGLCNRNEVSNTAAYEDRYCRSVFFVKQHEYMPW